MPSEVPTVSHGQSVEELRRELADAREQQAATAEILRMISSSPMDLRRIFAEMAVTAARVCDATDAAIFQVDADNLRLAAHHGPIPAIGLVGQGAVPLIRTSPLGRAVLDRETIHVADLQAEIDEYPEGSGFARRLGFRTVLNVPLVLAGRAIGGISTRRTEARPFTDRQIDLLKTFADQAVIAIENTRLFEEVQARSRDLAQSLEYQTATSEVLKVISRSPSELQHVLDAIVATAIKLCEGFDAIIFLKEGDRLRVGVHHGDIPLGIESMPLGRGWATGWAVIDCAAVHVHDFALMREEFPEGHQQSARDGARTGLAVPLLRDGDAIGAFMIRRKEVRPFSDKQIALLKTFADQAVIRRPRSNRWL
jgi:GAF domain-containing protein